MGHHTEHLATMSVVVGLLLIGTSGCGDGNTATTSTTTSTAASKSTTTEPAGTSTSVSTTTQAARTTASESTTSRTATTEPADSITITFVCGNGETGSTDVPTDDIEKIDDVVNTIDLCEFWGGLVEISFTAPCPSGEREATVPTTDGALPDIATLDLCESP